MAAMDHHYDSSLPLEYQSEENRLKILGFWIFLGAEIVLFSTLFATYLVLVNRTAGGPTVHDLFELKGVLLETLALLTSSFTCGLAIYEMRRHRTKGLLGWLAVTLILGLCFISLEINEFVTYVHDGATMQTSAFLSSFFTLVGTHGAHVSLGIIWMSMIIIQMIRRGLTQDVARKTFIVSLYWHFLDVVWIFIYTLVYLNGMVG